MGLGTIAAVAGLPLAVVFLRGMHDLSRRWVVFVPAAKGTDALDLTQKAPGLVLQLDLTEELEFALVRPGRRLGEPAKGSRLLITPTRPGALLDEARHRRMPVG